MTPAICNVCTIYIFAKLGHATALFLATADDKVYFIENQKFSGILTFCLMSSIDLQQKPTGILRCSSKTRKSMKMSATT